MTEAAVPSTSSSASILSRRWRTIMIGGLLLVAAGALVAHALAYSFVCDDAYISFRYSHNFAYHNELTFNPGERVEGYTNFLWTLSLGLLLKLGLRPEVMSQVLGAACGIAVLLLLFCLTRIYRGGRANGWDLVGALLLPTWGSFAVWCSGGLETQMFCALGLAGITLYVAEHRDPRRRRWSGFVFALAAMTRPEGLLLFGLTGLHRLATNLLGERRILPRRAEILWVLGFLAPFGLFMAWRYHYYGYPFPNTFYVKSGAGLVILKRWGLAYLWDFVHQNRLYALLVLLPLFRPRTFWAGGKGASRRHEAPAPLNGGVRPLFLWSYLFLIVVVYLAYVAYVGGDFMAMGRFCVPVLPLLALFAQEGLRESVERFPRRRDPALGALGPRDPGAWRPLRMALVTLAVVAGGIVNSVGLYRDNQKMAYHRWGLDTIAYLKKFADDRIIIGGWMRKHLPKDTYITVGGAGATVYASRLRALDAFGLNDSWIAHNVPAGSTRPGHSKFAPQSYVLKQKPDLICHIGKHQDYLYRPPAHEVRRWGRLGYRWVCLNPKGVRPEYYCCLKRKDRDLGPLIIEVGS